MSGFLHFSRFLHRVLFAILVVGEAACAFAGEGDTLRPFFNASMGYDSNLFRFASSIPSITYQRYGAGVDMDWKQGRQQVKARLAADKTRYSKFSSLLDYTGRDINGEWKWQLGNRWSGLLSAKQNRTLAPYSNYLTKTIDSNVRTENQQVFQADYWFHTDWRARARLSNSSLAYSAATQKVRDNDSRRASFGLYRLGQAVESVGVELSNTDGSYDNLPPGVPDQDFREQGIRLVGTWNYSGKTRFNGHLGYIQRSRQSPTGKDFSGPEWRFEMRWQPSGKSQIEGAFFRDLRANDAADAGYEMADGVSLTAVWLVAPKTRLIGQGSYENIEYQGSTRRTDKLASLGVSASYEIWRGGDIAAGLQHSRRKSNDSTAKFDSNALFVSANLKF